jgi:uncharacterized protein (UPF0332 family)
MNADKAAYADRKIANARKILNEVIHFHVENELWNTAVNRLYYASFHAVSALLYCYGFESKTHAGAQTLFGLHFVQTGIVSKDLGRLYSKIFSMRQSADYEDEIEYEKDDVMPLLQPIDDFIVTIEIVLSQK